MIGICVELLQHRYEFLHIYSITVGLEHSGKTRRIAFSILLSAKKKEIILI